MRRRSAAQFPGTLLELVPLIAGSAAATPHRVERSTSPAPRHALRDRFCDELRTMTGPNELIELFQQARGNDDMGAGGWFGGHGPLLMGHIVAHDQWPYVWDLFVATR